MKKITIYIILVAIAFSGFQELRSVWNATESIADSQEEALSVGQKIDAGLKKAKELYGFLTKKGLELKDDVSAKVSSANEKLKALTEKYDQVKNDFETKSQQLQDLLNEVKEAEQALKALVDEQEEAPASDTPQ